MKFKTWPRVASARSQWGERGENFPGAVEEFCILIGGESREYTHLSRLIELYIQI